MNANIERLAKEVISAMKLTSKDTIDWRDNGDGSFTVAKVKTELVLVECINTFRQRYVVEVPVGNTELALSTVELTKAKEFSQLHLGETIVGYRVISNDEVLALCDEDNTYCKKWDDEHKTQTFVTLINSTD